MEKVSLALLISAASLLSPPCFGAPQGTQENIRNLITEEDQSDSCVEFDTAFQGDGTFQLVEYQNTEYQPNITWQECGQLCNYNPNCKYWTLREDESFSGCRLKTGFNIRSNITGAFSGAKGCPIDWCAKLYEHGAGNKKVPGWEKIVGQGKTDFNGTKYHDQASSIKIKSGCSVLLYDMDKLVATITNYPGPTTAATTKEFITFENSGEGNYNDAIDIVTCTCGE